MKFGRIACAVAIVSVAVVLGVAGHSRWVCPPPRSTSTGIKTGPCGSQTGDLSGAQVTLSPGWTTLVFEESIAHVGAPFRIALSLENADSYEECLLLNHIPHDDTNAPVFGNERTYTRSRISVLIPDVRCDRCALQLVNPMTDKLPQLGLQNCTYDATCTTCQEPLGTCFSTYHSCANVRITGSVPRDQFVCPPQPRDWPYASLPPFSYFVGEAADWDDRDWLLNVPEIYRTPVGPCKDV
eukprot:TRINITY_DN329_c0_g1_i1.p1 TRINITY_DN329_c0_g1~~TRINITY_DN329_c0_g1_i1.p1  ORF type:complete len:240 (-),score=21.18 TRINITY_DN329_c0_g1_i1:308-1027(-)